MARNGIDSQFSYPTTSVPAPPHDPNNPCTVLVSTRAVITTPQNTLVLSPATITISPATGLILAVTSSILPQSSFPAGTTYIDHSPHILLPGLVDAHVHLNEPGRTEWEGFWTGTRSAASGGVTTVIDMPLNSIPPTTTMRGLREKVEAADGQCWVDVGFYGGIIPGNTEELLPLVEAGVRGFKGFLIESGVEEFPAVSSHDIGLAMAALHNSPTTLLFHAEMIPPVTDSVGGDIQGSNVAPHGSLDLYSTFLSSRPSKFETCAIEEILSLAHLAPKLQLHIVHLSAVECIPLLHDARDKGIKISSETCFHYLALAAEDVATGDTRHKCCPPIREARNREALWAELSSPNSVIGTIVSDHSPCTPQLKLLPNHILGNGNDEHLEEDKTKNKGDFLVSWGGISSVGLGLSILWSSVHSAFDSSSGPCFDSNYHNRNASQPQAPRISILDIVKLCCVNTAIQVGLQHQKGAIAPGMDADICVFDDKGSFVLEQSQILFRNKVTPYQGKELRGLVLETYLRGKSIYTRNAGFREETPRGNLLLEKRKC